MFRACSDDGELCICSRIWEDGRTDISVFDTRSLKPLYKFCIDYHLVYVIISKDKEYMLLGDDYAFYIYTIEGDFLMSTRQCDISLGGEELAGINVSKDFKRVLTCCITGDLMFFDINPDENVKSIELVSKQYSMGGWRTFETDEGCIILYDDEPTRINIQTMECEEISIPFRPYGRNNRKYIMTEKREVRLNSIDFDWKILYTFEEQEQRVQYALGFSGSDQYVIIPKDNNQLEVVEVLQDGQIRLAFSSTEIIRVWTVRVINDKLLQYDKKNDKLCCLAELREL
ncbi:hypothetical protein PCE1_000334 [Barthelona sp. PCE]